jgi:uncharacterized protein
MFRLKNLFIVLIGLTMLLMVACSGNEQSSSKEELFSIGTASMGGAFYPVGQEIANLITKYVDGVQVTPEVTGGAVENPRLTDNKDVEMSLTNANLAHFAVNGTEPYTEKLNVSAIAPLHPSILHIIAKGDSSINTIADLKGKKVAVGPAGGGSIEIFAALLEQVGLTLDDISATYLSYADGFTQLSDGNVDVALALAGYPTSAVVEASTSNSIKFISVDDELAAKVTNQYPYYSKVIVPKDVYKLDTDPVAIGVNNLLIVNNDLDEDVVYKMTKAIFDHLEEFQEANANAKQINLDDVSKISIPLHPGAKKYFDENKK